MQHALADIAELCELPRDADPGAIVEAVRATRERDWEARQAMLGRTSRID